MERITMTQHDDFHLFARRAMALCIHGCNQAPKQRRQNEKDFN